jgi:hypothetical protein
MLPDVQTTLCACDLGGQRRVCRYRRTVLRSSIKYSATNLHKHHYATGTTKRHCALLDLPLQLHQCYVCLHDQRDAHVNAAADHLASREPFSHAFDLSANSICADKIDTEPDRLFHIHSGVHHTRRVTRPTRDSYCLMGNGDLCDACDTSHPLQPQFAHTVRTCFGELPFAFRHCFDVIFLAGGEVHQDSSRLLS